MRIATSVAVAAALSILAAGETDPSFCNGRATGYYAAAPCSATFYQCFSSITYVKACAAGLVWNDESAPDGACDWPYNVPACTAPSPSRAVPSPSPAAPSPSPAAPSPSPAVPPPSPSGCSGAPPSCKGKEGQFLADSTACNKYYWCVHQQPLPYTCAGATIFTGAPCDWPPADFVCECDGGTAPPPSPAAVPSPHIPSPPSISASPSTPSPAAASPSPVGLASPVPSGGSGSGLMVGYWGQNSAGWSNADRTTWEKPLREYCTDSTYDIIVLAFMHVYPGTNGCPQLNHAYHCESTFPDTSLLTCPTIGEDIMACQAAGKKVLLSMGGAVGSYGFSNDVQGALFADTVWDMFMGGSGASAACPYRPYGAAVLDGVDLDIENNSPTGYAAFVNRLTTLYNSEGDGRKYFIAGAPQCPFPDASMGPQDGSALSDSAFDWIFVQFYNNYCSVRGGYFNFQTWADWAADAPNPSVKIFMGLPASSSAAGSGYITYDEAAQAIDSLRSNVAFGGVMLWDVSQSDNNLVNGVPYGTRLSAHLKQNT